MTTVDIVQVKDLQKYLRDINEYIQVSEMESNAVLNLRNRRPLLSSFSFATSPPLYLPNSAYTITSTTTPPLPLPLPLL